MFFFLISLRVFIYRNEYTWNPSEYLNEIKIFGDTFLPSIYLKEFVASQSHYNLFLFERTAYIIAAKMQLTGGALSNQIQEVK